MHHFSLGNRQTFVTITWLLTGSLLFGCLMKSVPVTKRALASHDECVVDAGEGGNVTAEFTKLDVAVHFEIGHFSPAQDLGKIQVRYVFLPLQEEFFSQFVRGPPRC